MRLDGDLNQKASPKEERSSDPKQRYLFRFAAGESVACPGIHSTLQQTKGKSYIEKAWRFYFSQSSKGDKSWDVVAEELTWNVVPERWHFIVISHSHPYLRKSRVACFVDGRPELEAPLKYPKLDNPGSLMSRCSLGAGLGGRLAWPTLLSTSMTIDREDASTSMLPSLRLSSLLLPGAGRADAPADRGARLLATAAIELVM